MGLDIDAEKFNTDSIHEFAKKLNENLDALSLLLSQDNFGQSTADSLALGAELELYIVDAQGRPVAKNTEIQKDLGDPLLTLELNRYNLEYNLNPYRINQQPLFSGEQDIIEQLANLNEVSKKYNAQVVPIGILPTLKVEHFGPDYLTDKDRYHVLVDQLEKRRGKDFEIDINGRTPLKMSMSDVTLEGANTSFQIHYRVNPQEYVQTYNAIQLVTPLMLAISANSPGIFFHELWQETRIPLFKQTIDTRHKDRYEWCEPARVTFGHGWFRKNPAEAFQETVRLFSPILPICGKEDALQLAKQGKVPKLEELRLHLSTVWWWNRAVFDDADNGHLRIEMRALPAGPTAIDMMANTAFYLGLAEYYKNIIDDLTLALPFNGAEYNFYRAAQFGLDAQIVWPSAEQTECKKRNVIDILEENVTFAKEGLKAIGISSEEIERYMPVIEKRISSRQNGAIWQQARFKKLNKSMGVEESYREMLKEYIVLSRQNIPVSDWEV